jgi:hypothetical protein
MTQTQRDVVIKSLYVNVYDKNIFDVLNGVHAGIRAQKTIYRMQISVLKTKMEM